MKAVVIGSLNMDATLLTEKLPKKGETIFAEGYYHSFGGKGANQAVAAARLGAEVCMVGCVGGDPGGKSYIEKLNSEGVNTGYIKMDEKEHTGTALITVQKDGSNTIVVYSGANLCVTPEYIDSVWSDIKDADIIIVQFEIPMETVFHIGEKAFASGIKLLVNPAPACAVNAGFIRTISYLTPNETELELLSGESDIDRGAEKLLASGIENVVVTLGRQGSCWYSADERVFAEAFNMDAVDTTAAGDCFNGAFAIALSQYTEKKEILRFANAAAGLSVTRRGAIDSLPALAEVEKFLAEQT